MQELGRQAAGVGALADATRRALYEYVVSRAEPVGREEAAGATGIPTHTAAFHLDKLVDAGLLDTEFRRLSGRTGPGAGRPSKLYRRAAEQWSVSLPDRHYDLVGTIMASGIERTLTGAELGQALDDAAGDHGREVGAASAPGDLGGLSDVLGALGYEPRRDGHDVVLSNCPFDTLARDHTELVCGLNRSFVQGVADGLGCQGVTAVLEPAPDRCCVTARQAP